jgi:glycosyltransferase involved in cell wall biosynthesis
MRIAFVTNLCPHYRRPLFEELSRRLDVDFFFTSRGREWYWLGAAPDPGSLRVRTLRRPAALATALGRYDAVVATLTGRVAPAASFLAAHRARLPFVLWVGLWAHPRTLFHRVSRPLARALYRNADSLVVYGPHVAEFVARESGRTEGVFVAPQAVENERFRAPAPSAEIESLRRRLGLNGEVTAVFVGRLEPDKGVDLLLRASALARHEHRIVVAGEGPEELHLRRLAGELGIAGRVRFPGKVPQAELPVLLQGTDLLVLPSVSTRRFREPWGLVVNEAMNCGLPVVATDAVGATAGGLVVQGSTGLVVPERNVDALAAALDELVADEPKRVRMGEAARARVAAWSYDAAAGAFETAIAAAAEHRQEVSCGS